MKDLRRWRPTLWSSKKAMLIVWFVKQWTARSLYKGIRILWCVAPMLERLGCTHALNLSPFVTFCYGAKFAESGQSREPVLAAANFICTLYPGLLPLHDRKVRYSVQKLLRST